MSATGVEDEARVKRDLGVELAPRSPCLILPGRVDAENSTGCSFRGLSALGRRAFIAGVKCRRGHSPLSLAATGVVVDKAGDKPHLDPKKGNRSISESRLSRGKLCQSAFYTLEPEQPLLSPMLWILEHSQETWGELPSTIKIGLTPGSLRRRVA